MSRIAYVNGAYIPHQYASVHIEDRGYQFSDGVYEVCEVLQGQLVDGRRHLNRLERSLSELHIKISLSRKSIEIILREVIRRNHVNNGMVYIQITRGVAPRNHLFPEPQVFSSIVVMARSSSKIASDELAKKGVQVITVPDNRWERVDIKSISLLPNVLAKQYAKEQGAYESWFVDKEGYITEGTSTNAWIVDTNGVLITRPIGTGILAGITRSVILDLIKKEKLKLEERLFTVEEAEKAHEAFITAATTIVMPVIAINGCSIGNGYPGSLTQKLRASFHSYAEVARIDA